MKPFLRSVPASSVADIGPATFELQPAEGQRRLLKQLLADGRSVAVVEVGAGAAIKMRLIGRVPDSPAPPTLTEAEAKALASGAGGRSAPDATIVIRALAEAAYSAVVESAVSVDDAGRLLGVNASRVRQRLAERSLYGIKHAGSWRLPAFQFTKRGLIPGIEIVLKALPADLSVVAVARWFETPNPDLCTRDDDERPLTPLEWLASGHPAEAAAELASAL